jgi:hypothetical protein
MSEAAIAGSFDIWRRYMRGRTHLEEGREIEEVSREEMISATGEPIADEKVQYDESQQGVIDLCDDFDSRDSRPDESCNYEIEEAYGEDGQAGALEQSEPHLLDLSWPCFLLRYDQNEVRKMLISIDIK